MQNQARPLTSNPVGSVTAASLLAGSGQPQREGS